MDIRYLSDRFAVSPQVLPEHMATLADKGFTAVICNRPDDEVEPDLQCDAMAKAAEAAGLSFHRIPVGRDGLNPEMFAQTAKIIEDSTGPVFAYCRSGTRSSYVWALTMAPDMAPDAIIAAAAQAGYDLRELRPQLQMMQG
ncbi:TIGR01244 family sulfur transferase [Actibacterium ureilyticum]|uniref:TIGR01244 family sulfur transferase n=1 Tax=Actibacterium ureilyticum TaxID=1590614 RepID=UPI000BAAEDF2|nr:TIGR01244 family sulfur transferase [Actibacterium ureilyticum]